VATVTDSSPDRLARSAPDRGRLRKSVILLGLGGGVWVLDHLSKLAVGAHLDIGESMPLVGDVVSLTHIINRGGLLGLRGPGGGDGLILSLALIAVGIFALAYFFMPTDRRLRLVAVALILGGAVSNLFDRFGDPRGVVDFLQLELGFRRPVLNVADVAVIVGVIMLSWGILSDERKLRGKPTRTA
jgi:signal peptidase II